MWVLFDVSHISITTPFEYRKEYFNRKSCHSILLQGDCQQKGLFCHISSGQPGSFHDSRVLKLCSLPELAEEVRLFPLHTRDIGGVSVGYYILGDSAYPLNDWLMKPFSDNRRLTRKQQSSNYRLIWAQVEVENMFGRLKGRWRFLQKRNECDIDLFRMMVTTCCALHNLCECHGEVYNHTWDIAPAGRRRAAGAGEATGEGRAVRNALVQLLQHD